MSCEDSMANHEDSFPSLYSQDENLSGKAWTYLLGHVYILSGIKQGI